MIPNSAYALNTLGLDIPSVTNRAELYAGILNSNKVTKRIINLFDLKKVYNQKYLDDVLEKLKKCTKIEVDSKSNIVSISVEDKDPQRSADIANAYVAILDEIDREFVTSEGSRKRQFLEKQLEKTKSSLLVAENNLKRFQQEHGLIQLDAQAQAIIEQASKIKGEIVTAETKLEILKQFGTVKQNEAILLTTEIDELKKHLRNIEIGHEVKNKSEQPEKPQGFSESSISFTHLPDLGLALARLLREVKIQENVFETLTIQYELAKIEESSSVGTIQVLDVATPPEISSNTNGFLILSLFIILSFIFFVCYVHSLEYYHLTKTDFPEKYRTLIKNLTSWKSNG